MRIHQLFYVTALFAASLNLFGMFGILVSCLIAGAWWIVYSKEPGKRLRSAIEVVVASFLLHVLTCCLLPGVVLPYHSGTWPQCNRGDPHRIRWEGYLAILAFLFFTFLPVFWLFPRVKRPVVNLTL